VPIARNSHRALIHTDKPEISDLGQSFLLNFMRISILANDSRYNLNIADALLSDSNTMAPATKSVGDREIRYQNQSLLTIVKGWMLASRNFFGKKSDFNLGISWINWLNWAM